MGRRMQLTPQLQLQIVAAIRAGGYVHIAAEAFSVPVHLLHSWLERGSRPKAREPYKRFAAQVREAEAQARLRAETNVFQKDPKLWLEHGPGRETAESPGWSVAVKPNEESAKSDNVLLDPASMRILQKVLEILEPHPELRVKVAAELDALANIEKR